LDSDYASRFIREVNVYHQADAVITVSAKEAEAINDFFPDGQRAYCVPDQENVVTSPFSFAERRGILFVSNFRHPPNVQAFRFLVESILPCLDPKLLAEHPLYVVGTDLQRFVTPDSVPRTPGLHILGWVPSVVPYIHRSRVNIVPLLVGAGTKRKLVQSMIYGTPSVSTTVGIEGLDLIDERHVLVADDPLLFARAISRLVSDEQLWNAIADCGREHIVRTHSAEAVSQRFEAALNQVYPARDHQSIPR
jgi:glycosyltransferase involved in cell wall biosynthesis